MQIKRIKVGELECNCYILEIDNNVIVIDPGDDKEIINKEIENKNILAVLITHNHFDHVGATSLFDENIIKDYNSFNEEKYQIGNFKFEIIKTPGHTDESITYYFYEDDIMFTGDFIFKDTIGRTDFSNSNNSDMIKSLKKISEYSNVKIYPGHGDSTNIDLEKVKFDYYISFLKF